MKASLLTVVVPGNVRCRLGVAPEYLYLGNVSSFTISIEHYFLYNFVYYIYLFLYLAVLGIHCCVGFSLAVMTYSSLECVASHCDGSCCRAQAQ